MSHIGNFSRRFKRQFSEGYRIATSSARILPHFIIIGAQKSGTTSLFHYLSQHPSLVPSRIKGVHFFDGGLDAAVDNFKKGPAWYRSQFPLGRSISKFDKVYEASPEYIFNPLVAKRMSSLIPNVRLVAILRNPTERAISHYFHNRRKGNNSLPAFEALQAEEGRLNNAIEKSDFKSFEYIRYSYKKRGIYGEQLKRYFEEFSVANVLVLDSESFFARPADTLRRVCNFLDVDDSFSFDEIGPLNVGTNRDAVDPGIYEYLGDYFRPHNEALYELIGRDFGW